jgi:hypothetical protein
MNPPGFWACTRNPMLYPTEHRRRQVTPMLATARNLLGHLHTRAAGIYAAKARGNIIPWASPILPAPGGKRLSSAGSGIGPGLRRTANPLSNPARRGTSFRNAAVCRGKSSATSTTQRIADDSPQGFRRQSTLKLVPGWSLHFSLADV